MTTWWWVRHGPTHQKAFVGWRDVAADLSDSDQVKRLHDCLPEPALLVASDLIRASATADAIAGTRRRLPDTPLLREFNFGDWDGMHFADVAQRDPDLSRAYWEQPGDISPPNGESWNSAAARVRQFVDEINSTHPATDVVAVAHIGVIMTQIELATGQPASEVIANKIDNLSVTKLVFDGAWRADFINHAP